MYYGYSHFIIGKSEKYGEYSRISRPGKCQEFKYIEYIKTQVY
jgi:hypothetical protein